jgi:hypothetical protein
MTNFSQRKKNADNVRCICCGDLLRDSAVNRVTQKAYSVQHVYEKQTWSVVLREGIKIGIAVGVGFVMFVLAAKVVNFLSM